MLNIGKLNELSSNYSKMGITKRKEINFGNKLPKIDENLSNLVFGVVDKFHALSKDLKSGKEIKGYSFDPLSKFSEKDKTNLQNISKKSGDGTVYGIRKMSDNYLNNSCGLEIFFQKPEEKNGLWNMPKKSLLQNSNPQEVKFKLWCYDEYNSNIYRKNLNEFSNSIQNSNDKNSNFEKAISLAKKYLPNF